MQEKQFVLIMTANTGLEVTWLVRCLLHRRSQYPQTELGALVMSLSRHGIARPHS